jgi:hypothetical protein
MITDLELLCRAVKRHAVDVVFDVPTKKLQLVYSAESPSTNQATAAEMTEQ